MTSAAHCINPDCSRPYPQPWGNKFCNCCGAPLQLNNRYIPLQTLGSGGFAAIYTVWDLQLAKDRVLKVLLESSSKAQELFEQEASVLASLHHPGVPSVEPDSYFVVNLGHPSYRRLPCLVMEKINGQTLQDILERHYPQGCPEPLVANWLKQALDILQELHRRQIIHRDIKPSNLMLRQETGQLVAIDFGGAKQIGTVQVGQEASSTRLISPGYSPPEQIFGGAVGPAADFYALGQTMIHLLTGRYPPELEDPATGELRWRHCVPVSLAFADLLDDMVQADVRQRPATAVEIQQRLAGDSSMKTKTSQVPQSFSDAIATIAGRSLKLVWVAIASIVTLAGQTALFVVRAIAKVVTACLDTLWEMLVGGIAGGVFAVTGFSLAYVFPLGTHFAALLAQLPPVFPYIPPPVGQAILLFAFAGWGTAWGLTEAGGFGQRKRRLVAGLMGVFGYGLGWLVCHLMPAGTVLQMVTLIAVAVGPLTLGLGLPSHQLVHAIVAAAGTAGIFGGLGFFTLSSFDLLPSLGFFSLLGVTIAFWLGVSYYLVVPFLRWLGWR
ncbi:serine/threonine protein kinase [Coleofasciculus sp. FACHB-64]|uniref:protein kinase domain-containing protein n=1 Tax=Cyanophyceae TaxID=3028117 RepID=UPI0016885FA5|nr:serine/threonine protein kinase [Coleofasciculus sp. FACHB-501]MBD2045110.1 serine/threonine protein kinase [Coleofasciculus sp. FACHB-64]